MSRVSERAAGVILLVVEAEELGFIRLERGVYSGNEFEVTEDGKMSVLVTEEGVAAYDSGHPLMREIAGFFGGGPMRGWITERAS